MIASLDTTGDLNEGKCLWPEVFKFISDSLTTPSTPPHLAELSYLLLFEMTLIIGEHLPSLYAPLSSLYMTTLVSQDNRPEYLKVKNAALQSLGTLMSFLSDDEGDASKNQLPPIHHFAQLVPVVLQTADACRMRQDEDTLQVINDVVFDLVNSPLEVSCTFFCCVSFVSLSLVSCLPSPVSRHPSLVSCLSSSILFHSTNNPNSFLFFAIKISLRRKFPSSSLR